MSEKREIFEFKNQNDIGKLGEKYFLKFFGNLWKVNNSKKVKAPDFISIDGKTTLELKTDTYILDMNNVYSKTIKEGFTSNLFLEIYSDKDKRTDGGFFRAYKEGAKWLVYSFFSESTKDFDKRIYFFFKINKKVMSVVERYKKSSGRLLNIPNNGYMTQGRAIHLDTFLKEIGKDNYLFRAPGKVVKYIPSYVGSKAYWLDKIEDYCKGQDIYEAFCGSAIISINFAKSAILNDLDPYIYKLLKNYQDIYKGDSFTQEEYLKLRWDNDWWKYLYHLQKMSFSGVFRYSKNGYNVPPKRSIDRLDGIKDEINISQVFNRALSPTIYNKSFFDLDISEMKDKVVILDPPYENSKTAYNNIFCYERYWDMVGRITKIAKTVIVFDYDTNIEKQNIPVYDVRKMRVNGSKKGSNEGIAIYQDGEWKTRELEQEKDA